MTRHPKDISRILRNESVEELRSLPVPTHVERDHAYQLLPNCPLSKDDALDYGALMFALGRRQVSIEVNALIKALE